MAGKTFGSRKSVEILLIEDNPGDIRLIIEAFKDAEIHNNLTVAADGVEAMNILNRVQGYTRPPRPDLILLDLNLPRKDGREVLAEIKTNETLKRIPVIILTTSQAEEDVLKSYDLNANCYIHKPVDLNHFITVIKSIKDFWLNMVVLPKE